MVTGRDLAMEDRPGKGAATVFTQTAGAWAQNTSLAPVGTPAQFGAAVALSANGTTALVGDPTAATFGTATLYTYQSPAWSAGLPLAVTPNAGAFGTAVALSSDGTPAAVGDPNGGALGTGALTVFSFDSTKAPSKVSPVAAPVTSLAGASVNYSATVTPQSGPGTPGGTVIFTMGLTTLCTTPTLVAGAGNCNATNTPTGHGVVVATYSGDATYAPSTAGAPVVVNYPSSTGVTTLPTASAFGSTVTYSATITPQSGPWTPTGTVTFTVGVVTLCTTTPLVAEQASCTAANAPVGSDTVTGTYSGDANFAGSAGTTSLAVSRAASTTTIAVSPPTTQLGSAVAYAATVTSGAGTPTGTVTFSVGGTTLCIAGLAGGTAGCSASNAPAGADVVTRPRAPPRSPSTPPTRGPRRRATTWWAPTAGWSSSEPPARGSSGPCPDWGCT